MSDQSKSGDVIRPIDVNNTSAHEIRLLGYARRNWIPYNISNRPISPATINRWHRRGVHGVRLAVVHLPGGTATTEQACKDFLAAVDARRRSRGDRDAEHVVDATDDELQKAGLA